MKMGGMEILVPRLARGMGTGRRLRHERTVHGSDAARSEHVTAAAELDKLVRRSLTRTLCDSKVISRALLEM